MEKRTKQMLIGGLIVVAVATLFWFYKNWAWSNQQGSSANWIGIGAGACKITGSC